MIVLFKKFMLGKYMPTHSSTTQNDQKTRCSCDIKTTAESNAALANTMAACRDLEAPATLRELLNVVKSIEPAIIAHMKQAKIKPYGGSSSKPTVLRELTIAADQKNTNRYIIDSKNEDAVTRANIRLSGFND
jgi:hypothetical protein